MKSLKVLALAVLMLGAAFAGAQTWYVGGVLFGNVCRNGAFYTVYPIQNGQPVGTSCSILDGYGRIIGVGYVSNE